MPGHYGNGNGGTQTNLITAPNQFINRTTGAAVPAGVPYHVHNGQAMAGATHAEHQGATHDFYDPMPSTGTRTMMNTNMVRPVRTRRDSQRRQTMSMSTSRRTSSMGGGGYRRGGRVNNRRKMMHGGSHSRNNGCGPGMMYQNGGCVPASGGMRRGGRTRRRMRHGGHTHNVSAHHMSEAARLATFHYHGDAGAPFPTYIGNMGHDMYEQMNLPQYQSNYNIPESSHHHDRHGRPGISTTQMRRGGRPTRRMMHGGRHNGASDHHRKSAKRDSMGRK